MTQTVGNARSATLAEGLTHLTSATTRILLHSPVAISRHPATSIHDHVEHASSSSPSGHSEKHPQPGTV
jgi:hypothetical protein